jgi:hypothetical protein
MVWQAKLRFHILKTIRNGVASIWQLNVGYSALLFGRTLYCLSSWGGIIELIKLVGLLH